MRRFCVVLLSQGFAAIRGAFFRVTDRDPEVAHTIAIKALSATEQVPWAVPVLNRLAAPPVELATEVAGLRFRSPIGLAAGFDKNGHAAGSLAALFGFVEIGAVLPTPQRGSDRPRVMRAAKGHSLVNWMGFNSDGVDCVAGRLGRLPTTQRPQSVPIGVNIGKMRDTPIDGAVSDFEAVMSGLHPHVDFFVVNLSSPNTPGLRQLQTVARLEAAVVRLVGYARDLAAASNTRARPVFVKLAPLSDNPDLAAHIQCAVGSGAQGVVLSNTSATIALRDLGAARGGYSGPELYADTLESVRLARRTSAARFAVVASGGVWTGRQAFELLASGASLVEIYTAFVYRGPFAACLMAEELRREMERHGIGSVAALHDWGRLNRYPTTSGPASELEPGPAELS